MTRRRLSGLAALAALTGLAATSGACTDPAPDGPAITSGVQRIELPLARNRKLDLLFVIDNSPAMAPHRARLLDTYRHYVETLESRSGGFLDLHIGVVTTDVGSRGVHDNAPGPLLGTGPGSCTSEGDGGELRRVPAIAGRFLYDFVRANGTRERNYTGSLADAIAQLADVGASGCSYPRPLEAMRRALVVNPEPGFLRDNAALAVAFFTSDDDCSFRSSSFPGADLDRSQCSASPGALVSLEDYVTALRGVRGVDRTVLLGGFARPGAPACADTRPAPRLDAFFDRFPNRAVASSLCSSSLDDLFGWLVPQMDLLPLPCFDGELLDTDPAADGLQAECVAWYSYRDEGNPVEDLIPACAGDARGPCWELQRKPALCSGPIANIRDQRQTFDESTEARMIMECVSR